MSIESGFPEGASAQWVPPNPDSKYDELQEVARLKALEKSLSTSRRGWNDDPAERASDWINLQGNAQKVFADFEAAERGGDDFPLVWDRFGWAHKLPVQDDQTAPANMIEDTGRVLSLMNKLSDATLSNAVDGICTWLDRWGEHAIKIPQLLPVWLRLWPIAVEATNHRPENVGDEDLNAFALPLDAEQEPMDLDTLNTPTGNLVSVFLAACAHLSPSVNRRAILTPFEG
jgi:hypothetical protein